MKKCFSSICPILSVFLAVSLFLAFTSCQNISKEPVLSSIYLSQLPEKMNYAYDEALDLTGLVVTAKYSDGTEKTVDAWTSSPKPWTKLRASGSVAVTITYEGKTTSFAVIVAAEGDDVPQEQTKTFFATGAEVANVIYTLNDIGDSTICVTGKVTSEDFAKMNAALKSIAVGVTLDFSEANFSTIPESAFADCKMLKGIVIPAKVTNIKNFAFNGCTGMKSLRLEDSEESLTLGWNKYDNNSWNGWEGRGLFRDCPLESLYLGRNIEYSDYNDKSPEANCHFYGYSAFANIQSPGLSVEIGSKVKSIQIYTFRGCGCLSSIIINGSAQINKIEGNAFEYCNNLTKIDIPSTVTGIDNRAFAGCSKLKEITIPKSVAYICSEAFNGCEKLQKLILEDGDEPLTLGFNKYDNDSWNGWEGRGLFRDCPLESLYLGRNIEYSDYNDKSPEAKCHFYGYSAFANIQSPGLSVEIGPKVESIPIFIFSGCGCLNSIIMNGSAQIRKIESNAFENCYSLTQIDIPSTVTGIGNRAFAGCSKLKEITIPKSVAYICSEAFNGCEKLQKLILEDGDEPLTLGFNKYDNDSWNGWEGKGLFRDCSLESLYLGRNIKYSDYNDKSPEANFHFYGYSAFTNISTLATVTISVPAGLDSFTIGKYAFRGCTGINSVTFTTPGDEAWDWYRSSVGTATSGTSVDVSDTSSAASVLKNLGENYLHGKRVESVTIEEQVPEVTL